MKPRKRRKKPVKILFDKCPFCEGKKEPSYKEYEELKPFLTGRAKIIPSSISGVCSKHQRVLSLSIKHARHLALLPFSERV
ncbi:30S ribosomal protein S18 [Patescibacteria group bacterium]